MDTAAVTAMDLRAGDRAECIEIKPVTIVEIERHPLGLTARDRCTVMDQDGNTSHAERWQLTHPPRADRRPLFAQGQTVIVLDLAGCKMGTGTVVDVDGRGGTAVYEVDIAPGDRRQFPESRLRAAAVR